MNLEYGLLWNKTRALGPGNRFVIWTQGCCRRCYKCASPELQITGEGKIIDSEILANMICKEEGIDGITISGGEPMLQSQALMTTLNVVRERRPELTVILFTGFKVEELRMECQLSLLEFVDVLIDGEYVDNLNDNRGLRGSSNQRIYFLTNRLLNYRQMLEEGRRRREMHVLGPGDLLTIGISDNTSKSI